MKRDGEHEPENQIGIKYRIISVNLPEPKSRKRRVVNKEEGWEASRWKIGSVAPIAYTSHGVVHIGAPRNSIGSSFVVTSWALQLSVTNPYPSYSRLLFRTLIFDKGSVTCIDSR